MKRYLALLLAALLLFSGCTKNTPETAEDFEQKDEPTIQIEQTHTITTTPKPKEPEPPELMNTESQCAEILEFLNEICDIEDKSVSRLLYAKYSLPEDWEFNHEVPIELYQYPYNIDSLAPINPYGDFMSNKEFLSTYNQSLQDELIKHAAALGLFHANANGKSFEEDEFTLNAIDAVCHALLLDDVINFKQYDLDNSFLTEGRFLTDPSLIYQAVDGTMRVRGRLYMTPVSGSTEAINDLTPGEWYYADMEFILLPTQIAAGWFNLTPWTQNEITIIGYFYLHQYWFEAEAEHLAWLHSTEPKAEETDEQAA